MKQSPLFNNFLVMFQFRKGILQIEENHDKTRENSKTSPTHPHEANEQGIKKGRISILLYLWLIFLVLPRKEILYIFSEKIFCILSCFIIYYSKALKNAL